MSTAILSRYEILDSLGVGGMGQVLKARDRHLNRIVAIKKLLPGSPGDERAGKRFIREAHLAAQLNHPHIATVYDVFESNGDTFIAMEYIEGETLADLLRGGPLPLQQALHISLQVAEALVTAHKQDIVHRDIKPENIKITPEGQVKVLDFGVARRINRDESTKEETASETEPSVSDWVTQAGVLVGTPGYAAPEQWAGDPIDERADIFSFGVVLYEMISCRVPFRGPSKTKRIAATLHRDPDPLTKYVRVPSQLEDIIRKALAKDPDQRYQSMTEMTTALEELQRQLEAPVVPPGFHARLATLMTRLSVRRRVIVAGVTILLLIVVGVVLFFNPSMMSRKDLSVPPASAQSQSASDRMIAPANSPAVTVEATTATQPAEEKKRVSSKGNNVEGIFNKVGGGMKKVGGFFKRGGKKLTRKGK